MDRLRSSQIVHALAMLLLPLTLLVLTAGGASPLETQNATIGPYRLLLSYYSLPRVAQNLSMTIGSATGDTHLQLSQAMLIPAKGTDGNVLRVQLTPDSDTQGLYDVAVTPPVGGLWYLHITVQGQAGTVTGDIPMTVQEPPAMPVWLGWSIGMLPLPFLIAFLYIQVNTRNRRRKEMLQVQH